MSITHSYPGETGEFDYNEYFENLKKELEEQEALMSPGVWTNENIDYRRLPNNTNIFNFTII